MMLAVGAIAVDDFVQTLAMARVRSEAELKPNIVKDLDPELRIPESWREEGRNDPDPYFVNVFDENHVALVFVNLNDYYREDMRFVGGNSDTQKEINAVQEAYRILNILRK